MIALSLLSLLLATTTLAAPSQRRGSQGGCSVPASAFSLPAPLTPIQTPPLFTTVAFGVQNYTCTAFGNYSSIGAVARLFDASCLYNTDEFLTVEIDVFNLWDECPSFDPKDSGVADVLEQNWILPLGDHYFVTKNSTLTPVFDFTSTGQNAGNPKAIFFGKKIEDALSPDGTDNVDWVELENVGGELATTVYRVKTVEGQPPASCTPGSGDISVKYAAQYLFV